MTSSPLEARFFTRNDYLGALTLLGDAWSQGNTDNAWAVDMMLFWDLCEMYAVAPKEVDKWYRISVFNKGGQYE